MPSLLPGEADTNVAGSLIDQTVITAFLLPVLHSDTTANLVFWSTAELIQWIDAGVKRLARLAGLFIGRSVDGATAIGTATYPLPSQFLSTRHVSYNGAPLRPANTAELEARDPSFSTTPGTPARWYQDTLGEATVGLAPVPIAVAPLWLIYHGWPQTVDIGLVHTTIPLPWCLEGAIELYVIAQAYSKEGDAYAPDIAKHATDIAALYEAAAAGYWGNVG
jgi:hypothetical protein